MLRRLKPWQKWVIELLVILAVIVAVRAWTQRDLVTGPAPPLDARLLGGESVSLARLAEERGPLLVHFWATWCPVCDLEHGSVQAISEDHAVLGVAMQSGSAEDVEAFMREEGLDYPVVVDELGELARRFGVRGVPTSLIVDRDGQIRYTEVGFTTGWGLRARLWLAR